MRTSDQSEQRRRTAELIVRTLDIARDATLKSGEEDQSPQVRHADEIVSRYGRYKRRLSFEEAAWRARTEVVAAILEESGA